MARLDPIPRPARFGYFVLQTRTEWQAGTLRIAGVVENLVSGEKQNFESADDLARVLREWGGLRD